MPRFAPDLSPEKSEPARIDGDDAHFERIDDALRIEIEDVRRRRDAALRRADRNGQGALDRDDDVRRLGARLRLLERHGADMCLGRVRFADGSVRYIGRAGLIGPDGTSLLVDWRAPAAEPFFAATLAHPLGVETRRRYRWRSGRVVDYWDETLDGAALDEGVALDDRSAFIASLAQSRTARMRDVLGTVQADQDAAIRASSRGALVVDGGPGTGKTVVALHRAAYLQYADPALGQGHGATLFVGPHPAYLAYVDDVLPGLGEEGVRLATLRDLVPEGADAAPERDPGVARLKGGPALARVIARAIRIFEEPPTDRLAVMTAWGDVVLGADAWAEAFDAPDPGTPHNEARDVVWEALVDVVHDAFDHAVPRTALRRSLAADAALTRTFHRAWPVLDAGFVVESLWRVPALLRRCAPELTGAERAALRRDDDAPWTDADLPFLDTAHRLLGASDAARRARERERVLAEDMAVRDRVVEELIAADDDGEGLVTMLKIEDAQHSLVDESVAADEASDPLAGPFAHIIVDEAQELTDAQWRMLIDRCPSKSFTVVGDRAQARHGFAESWHDRLARVGLRESAVAPLTVNYRTPAEIMTEAAQVITTAVPDANVPTSVRTTGRPVRHGVRAERDRILAEWAVSDGTVCVIGDVTFPDTASVRSLSAVAAKGLEFDRVIVMDDGSDDEAIERAVDRYVAMTRATQDLAVLT